MDSILEGSSSNQNGEPQPPTRADRFRDYIKDIFRGNLSNKVQCFEEALFVTIPEGPGYISRAFYADKGAANGRGFKQIIRTGFQLPLTPDASGMDKTQQAKVSTIRFSDEINSNYFFSGENSVYGRMIHVETQFLKDSKSEDLIQSDAEAEYDQFGRMNYLDVDGLTVDEGHLENARNGTHVELHGKKYPDHTLEIDYDHKTNSYNIVSQEDGVKVAYTLPRSFNMDNLIQKAEEKGNLDPNLRYHAWDIYGPWDESVKHVNWAQLAGVSVDTRPS